MDISRSAFFTMLIINSGLMGLSLREGLVGGTRAAATDAAPAERPAAAVDQDKIPITMNAGSSATKMGSAPVVTIELRGGVVSLTTANAFGPRPALPCCDGPPILHSAAVVAPNPSINGVWTFAPTPSMRHQASYVTTIDGEPLRQITTAGPGTDQRWWTRGMPAQIFAENGSIIMIGDGGKLTANTGATSASGVVALGVEGSVLSTGTSSLPAIATGPPQTRITTIPVNLAALGGGVTGFSPVGPSPVATVASALRAKLLLARLAAQSAAALDRSPSPVAGAPDANRSFLGTVPRAGKAKGMGVAISGFEDHSVSVNGNNQIVTYDDSNVFIERNGEINANTGDTDSSGLNVVDVTESWVRSGNSGDAGSTGDKADEQRARKAPQAIPSVGEAAQDQLNLDVNPSLGGRVILGFAAMPDPGADGLALEPTAEESGNEHSMSLPQLQKGQSFAVVSGEGTPAAVGSSTFVVGDDGFDDVAIRSTGDRNIITYDDSNLVIGGTGKVNAEIGDSDTGGTIAMGIRNSIVEGGCEGDRCGANDGALRKLKAARARGPPDLGLPRLPGG